MAQQVTTEVFIEKARKIHGDKYDYSKVKYKNARTKVCIICIEHGEFWQTPEKHLMGCGCPKCGGTKKLSIDDFIQKARKVHGNKYDYSKVNYILSQIKICIICPEHGEFWQTPASHLSGKGCPKCSGRYMSTEYFIEKAKEIHNNKYDYSKVEYERSNKKICIICPKHGEFWQTPNSHLSGYGCLKCNVERRKLSTEEFIKKAKEIHGDKYDYSKVNYINGKTKICIICPKHGEFWQTGGKHLEGRGCPKCSSSKIEILMRNKLKELNITFEEQKKFDWLVYKQKMPVDFYLPKYNIIIECQGKQHYELTNFFGGDKAFKLRKYKDELKKKLCKKYNVILLYFNYNDDINEFEQKIKQYGVH